MKTILIATLLLLASGCNNAAENYLLQHEVLGKLKNAKENNQRILDGC